MKDETYIKLYRKMLDNKPLCRDHTAFVVFIWLLLRADYKTGVVETGRFVISDALDIHPSSVYRSLLRLSRNHKLLNIKSNNHFSVISIVNWHKFQVAENNNANNQRTTNEQPANTNQEYKNKRNKERERETQSINYLLSEECYKKLYQKYPLIEEKAIRLKCEQFYNYCQANGKKYKDYYAAVRNAVLSDQNKMPQKMAPAKPLPEINPAGLKMLDSLKKQFNVGEKL